MTVALLVGPTTPPGQVQTPLTHLQRLEMANQVNAGFTQMKTKQKRHRKILPVRTVSSSVWKSGHGSSGHQTQNQNPQENWKKLFKDSKIKGFPPEPEGGQHNVTSALGSRARTQGNRQIHQGGWDSFSCKLRK